MIGNSTRSGLRNTFFLVAISIISALNLDLLASLPLRYLCMAAAGVGAISLLMTGTVSRRGFMAIGPVYTAVFVVFHFGLAAAHTMGYNFVAAGDVPRIYDWFFDPAAKTALVLCVAGATALAAGICMQASFDRPQCEISTEIFGDESRGFPYSRYGFLILAASVAAWLAMVLLSGGPRTLFESYMAFLEATRGAPLMLSYLGIGIGMALMAVGETTRWRRIGLIIFAAWALIAFPLGLRGDVLFPLCGALAVAAMRRRPIGTGKLILVAIGVLVVISLVRVLRQAGLSGEIDLAGAGNPLDALAELGSSLRPVAVTAQWAAAGEPAMGGASYWAPLERLAHYLVPLWERPPSVEDQRLLNVVIQERVGTIGFSPVAEAYHNFRVWGPGLVMFLVGSLLGWLDRMSPSARNQAVVAVLIVPLLIQVRNAFAQVPGQFVAGVLLLLLGHLVWAVFMKYMRRGPVPEQGDEL